MNRYSRDAYCCMPAAAAQNAYLKYGFV